VRADRRLPSATYPIGTNESHSQRNGTVALVP